MTPEELLHAIFGDVTEPEIVVALTEADVAMLEMAATPGAQYLDYDPTDD